MGIKIGIYNDISKTYYDFNSAAIWYESMGCGKFRIDKVIFSNPATIVIWTDGTKTVVKAQNEPFDPEKGLAMAIAKKVLGNKANYYEVFKKYIKHDDVNNG